MEMSFFNYPRTKFQVTVVNVLVIFYTKFLHDHFVFVLEHSLTYLVNFSRFFSSFLNDPICSRSEGSKGCC